jgi:pimeloyl-ACP methyl ester carboxylesterase
VERAGSPHDEDMLEQRAAGSRLSEDVPRIEKRTVTLHGHRLAYRVGGASADADRTVLLLVHGIADSSASWRAVLPGLARRFTVIAPDLLGHGDSDKPPHDYSLGAYANLLRDLMVALGIERATLVGHSLGGGIAMQLAYQHPLRCERLVLVSSGGLGREVSWILRALAAPGVEYLMPVIFPPVVGHAGNLIGRGLRRLGLRPGVLANEWRTYAALTQPANRGPFVRTLRSVIDVGGQAVGANDRLYLTAHMPTLIVWGRRDRIIPVDHAIAALEAWDDSQLVIFERSGHFPHTEDPVRFVEAVTDFVDVTEPMDLDEQQWRAALTAGRRPDAIPVGEAG